MDDAHEAGDAATVDVPATNDILGESDEGHFM
jgi:hypothetical protein